MGITIESKNRSIDVGFFGFYRLRTVVAKLAAEDIGEHYEKLNEGTLLFGSSKDKFFEEYDRRINELSEIHNGEKDGILTFLYASDCEAEISVEICKDVYEVIKDYDDNRIYGYAGRPDRAMFKDFKELVKDCIDNNCSMSWC